MGNDIWIYQFERELPKQSSGLKFKLKLWYNMHYFKHPEVKRYNARILADSVSLKVKKVIEMWNIIYQIGYFLSVGRKLILILFDICLHSSVFHKFLE